jgi:hypothetical protein
LKAIGLGIALTDAAAGAIIHVYSHGRVFGREDYLAENYVFSNVFVAALQRLERSSEAGALRLLATTVLPMV